MLAVGAEAGHQAVVAMFVHRVGDRDGSVAAGEFLYLLQQFERFTLLQADEVLFVAGDQLFQAGFEYEQVFGNSHGLSEKTNNFARHYRGKNGDCKVFPATSLLDGVG